MLDFLPVLLGSDCNVYGMARSFHEEYGVNSVAIGKGRLPATANSHIVKVVIAEPRLEEDEIFCKVLIDFAKKQSKTLLLVPCGDNYTKLLVKNQDKLRPFYAFACMSQETFDKVQSKEVFYSSCEKAGFSFPKTAVCSYENYRSFEPPFDFPVVVKPSNSVAYWNCSFPRKKKVFVAQTAKELADILDAIYSSEYKDHIIIQDFIPGDDSHMRVLNCYSGTDGKVQLISLGEALLEEHSPEGIGSYAAIISGHDEKVSEQVRSFLDGIGYVGFSNFDMKYDIRDGSYKLFEMNPRQGRSSYFVTAAGYNLARWLVSDVLEEKPQPFTIATNRTLMTLIPNSLIFKYVDNEEIKKEAKDLIRKKKIRHLLWYEKDRGIKRLFGYIANQYNYRRKYRLYFGKKGLYE